MTNPDPILAIIACLFGCAVFAVVGYIFGRISQAAKCREECEVERSEGERHCNITLDYIATSLRGTVAAKIASDALGGLKFAGWDKHVKLMEEPKP